MTLKDVKLEAIDGNLYLLVDEIDQDDYCAFGIGGQKYIRKYAETNDLIPDWIKGIIAKGDEVGWVLEMGPEKNICQLSRLNDIHMAAIQKNDGMCKIEIQDSTHQYKDDVHPRDIKISPIFVDGRVIIYLF